MTMAHPINPQYDPDRIPIGQTEEETPEPLPRWVFIERSAYPYGSHDQDVYVGPFEGPDAEENAVRCMDHALLVDHLLQREGGGGTDCFVTVDQPDPNRDEIHIIDHTDPHHTGVTP